MMECQELRWNDLREENLAYAALYLFLSVIYFRCRDYYRILTAYQEQRIAFTFKIMVLDERRQNFASFNKSYYRKSNFIT